MSDASIIFQQFQRPIGLINAQAVFADNSNAFHDGLNLVRRIVTAFQLASSTNVGGTENIWLTYFANINKNVHDAILSGDFDKISKILSNPAETNLLYGFDGPTKMDMDAAKDQFFFDMNGNFAFDGLLSFAEAIGAARVPNPESPQQNSLLQISDVIDLVEDRLGFELSFPNIFQGEMGIKTKRGILSHRAVLALYHSWRINQLVGGDQNARILEIGAGLGRTAYFCRLFGARNFTIVDLPTTNISQAYFLGSTLGPEHVSLYREEQDAYVKIIPPEEFLASSTTYDLVANIDSMTEFSKETAMQYLQCAASRAKLFASFNHEENSFTVRDLLRSMFPREHISRFRHWLRRGYVEEIIRF